MKELNVIQVQEINGGFLPALVGAAMWAVKSTAIRRTTQAVVAGTAGYLGLQVGSAIVKKVADNDGE